ncbi:MAG: hypothetical protein SFV24_06240, partial [Gemmatimonadales bacterium]|nr:hypothetical protein [Gemmatimonadales bacterium]
MTDTEDTGPNGALDEVLQKLAHVDLDRLTREELKPHDFSGCRRYFDQAAFYSRLLVDVGTRALPAEVVGPLLARASDVQNAWVAADNLRPAAQDDWKVVVSNMPGRLEKLLPQFVREAVAALIVAVGLQAAEIETRTSDLLAQGRVQLEVLTGAAATAKEDREAAGAALAAVRAELQNLTVRRQATTFSKAASGHRIQANLWLALLGAAVAGTLYLAFVNLKATHGAPVGTWINLVQVGGAKLVVLTVLLTVIFTTGRLYRASRHNAVVNDHRANALASFEALVQSADPESRPAV